MTLGFYGPKSRIKTCVNACDGIPTDQLRPGSVKALVEAVTDLMGLLDDGRLVRNTSKDHEPDWAFKQIGFVKTLTHANLALASFQEAGK